MEIEKEIQQKTFKNEYHKLFVNLVYTANWFAAQNSVHLKNFGLTMQQFNILRIHRGQHPNPVTINLLTERMLDKMSNASRLVEKLRQKGLAERRICENDRRAVDVIITRQGLQLLTEIDSTEDEWEKQFHTLPSEEAAQLNLLLDKFRG